MDVDAVDRLAALGGEGAHPGRDHHRFHTGKPMLVCGNTADMLSGTRYAAHFTVTGDKSRHFGPFPCIPADAAGAGAGAQDSAGACC